MYQEVIKAIQTLRLVGWGRGTRGFKQEFKHMIERTTEVHSVFPINEKITQ